MKFRQEIIGDVDPSLLSNSILTPVIALIYVVAERNS